MLFIFFKKQLLFLLFKAPPAAAVSDSGVDGADSGAGDAAPEKEAKRRKLIPLPNVEGVEFEVVVQKSDADQQIMRKTDKHNYTNRS